MPESLIHRSAASLKRQFEEQMNVLGFGRVGSIPEDMSFRHWCEELGRKGLKVDRKLFRLDDRPALVPIYEAIPTHMEEARDWLLVIQKATQLGLTVWEVLADIYMAKKFSPINIGMFLPDQATASFKSEQRFMPILRSAPDLYYELTHRISETGASKYIGEGNVMTREVAESLLLFLWTSGKVSTESRPMDAVSLDEVQEMSLAQIDKVLNRVGDSDLAFKLMLSTANMPDADINRWYKLGTQEVFHSLCHACGKYSDLTEPAGGIFPGKSTIFNRGDYADAPRGEFLWICPACQAWIPDAQQGKYISQNSEPDARVRSFMLPRIISPKECRLATKMCTGFARARTGDQKKSFYNRTLARPYIDANQLPVTMEHCLACAAEGGRMGLQWEKAARDTYMGIDQMGGFNCVIIKRRMQDGRQAVVHVEAIYDIEPFDRCGELMKLYGVAICVVEQLPNVNSARAFSNKFPGRVFMTTAYQDIVDTMHWGDDLTKSDRRTEETERSRYTVTVNQYKAMQNSLYRIRDRLCLFPEAPLEQDCIIDGETKRVPIVHDMVFLHFTKTALVVEEDDETRKLRGVVKKIGIDPHFSYANMLCDIAWARNNGTGVMFIPNAGAGGAAETDIGRQVEKAMPGLPSNIIAMIDQGARPGTCGACYSFEPGADGGGQCTERMCNVRAIDPGCDLYIPKEN